MSIKSAILVILQLITMIYLLIFNYPIAVGIGLFFQIIEIIIGFWGILTIKIGNFNIQPEVKSESLIRSGPYKWIRNPMYLSIILFYFPIVVQHLTWINGTVFFILVTVLVLKMRMEEHFLEALFDQEYLEYKSNSKRLIPYIY